MRPVLAVDLGAQSDLCEVVLQRADVRPAVALPKCAVPEPSLGARGQHETEAYQAQSERTTAWHDGCVLSFRAYGVSGRARAKRVALRRTLRRFAPGSVGPRAIGSPAPCRPGR